MDDTQPPAKRGRGRPKKPGGPISARARAEAYRERLRQEGGVRLTLNPDHADLVREALKFALHQQTWNDADRVTLELLRETLKRRR